MRKKSILAIILATLTLLVNCTSAPMQGILLTSTDQHIYDSGRGSQLNSGKIVRSGESCSYGSIVNPILPLFTSIIYAGAGGIEKAKENGGIKKVAVVDKSSFSVIGPYPLFYKECTVVWGE